MKVSIDLNALTFGDLADIEHATGERVLAALDRAKTEGVGSLSASVFTAIVWIFGRKEDPELTYEAVRESRIVDAGLSLQAAESAPSGTRATRRQAKG